MGWMQFAILFSDSKPKSNMKQSKRSMCHEFLRIRLTRVCVCTLVILGVPWRGYYCDILKEYRDRGWVLVGVIPRLTVLSCTFNMNRFKQLNTIRWCQKVLLHILHTLLCQRFYCNKIVTFYYPVVQFQFFWLATDWLQLGSTLINSNKSKHDAPEQNIQCTRV